MIRRLVYTAILSTLIMIPFGIGNYIIYPDASNIPEANRTLAQQLATQQRNATFYTVTSIHLLLIWAVAFMVIDRWITLKDLQITKGTTAKLAHNLIKRLDATETNEKEKQEASPDLSNKTNTTESKGDKNGSE